MLKVNSKEIEWLMLEKGFSINKLSKETKLSTGTISKILNNKCSARPETVSKIAVALKVNPRKLYTEK